MNGLGLFPVFALGAGLMLNAVVPGSPDAQALEPVQIAAGAQAGENEEIPADIIAVQIRKQGYECKNPESAKRDPDASSADLPVWILKCENASYRVRLVGNMADHIEKL
jgi:hypothetical protein